MTAHLIGEVGPSQGLIFDIEEGEEKTIGRDPDESSFVLDDPTVSRKHARFTHAPEGVYLENLSRISPTLINEEPIDGHVLLKEGDRIQIGRSIFLFSEKEAPKKPVKKNRDGYDEIFKALEDLPKETVEGYPTRVSNGYDTIFEDKSLEEALPFHLTPEAPYLLKVISGPNNGAEIGLEKGKSYIIGKDPSVAEIVFQDLSVSKKHAKLTVKEDGSFEIEDFGSKNGTFVGGEKVTEPKKITSQDLVTLGTTVFVVLDRESPQDTIFSAVPLSSREEAKKEEELVLAEDVAVETDWRKIPIPPKYLAIAGSFCLVTFIIFITLFSLFQSEQVEVAQHDPSHQIKNALSKFEGVSFSFNPASGKLFLVGHVLSNVDAAEMLYRINEIDFITSVDDNVVIDELVDKTMNDLLSGMPAFKTVTIQSLSPGKFGVIGYVDTNAQYTALSEYLAVNFPYLDKLDYQVAIGENINIEIQSLLQSHGFGSLSFQFTGGDIVLSGNYSRKETKEFEEMVKEMKAIHGIRALKNFAIPTNPNQAAIDISENFKVTGIAKYDGKGYSVILNGKIYEVGDLVAGLMITEIDPNTILLEKDKIKYKINYTR